MINSKRKNFLYPCAILGITLLLWLLAHYVGGFAEWYALKIFPLFPHTIGRLFSVLPFSMAEILLLALVAFVAFLLLFTLAALNSAAARARLGRLLPRLGRGLPLAVAIGLLLFMLSCGLNYQRASIAVYAGLETRPSSAQELRQLYAILVQQAAELAPQTNRDSAGQLKIFLPQLNLHDEARNTMLQLSRSYSGLTGYYPNPKPLILSEGMSWLNLSGVYSPFTIEANYNSHMPMLAQPFSICHELAHLGGYSREDEANFIAYLACQRSDSAAFRYSGAFQALIYVLNALHGALPAQEYSLLYEELPMQVRQDLQQTATYWQQYEGRAAEISENVNNAYLKANSQADGVQSYGRMVDLLIAYYL